MSIYFYLQCLDHDPPLLSESEVGQHYYDLPNIRRVLDHRDELVGEQKWRTVIAQFDINAVRFLHGHPKCRIGIVDEYGDTYPLKVDEYGGADDWSKSERELAEEKKNG